MVCKAERREDKKTNGGNNWDFANSVFGSGHSSQFSVVPLLLSSTLFSADCPGYSYCLIMPLTDAIIYPDIGRVRSNFSTKKTSVKKE